MRLTWDGIAAIIALASLAKSAKEGESVGLQEGRDAAIIPHVADVFFASTI
jgi:hypothetical protein